MIMALRKALSDKWIKVILWVPILAMGLGSLLMYVPNLFKDSQRFDKAALTINGEEIDVNELQHQIQREVGRIQMIRQQLGSNADMFLKMYGLDDPRALATQSLITETLLDQVAKTMHLQVDPKLVLQKLQDPSFIVQSFPEMLAFGVFNQNGTFNMPALRAYAVKTNQTITSIEEKIEQSLLRSLVTDITDATVYVGEKEIKKAFTQDFLSKKFSILTLPLSSYIAAIKKEGVSAEELVNFYDKKNKDIKQYWVPQKRSGSYWTFTPENYGITITDKQIQSYYEQNKHKQFVESPVQVQVRSIVFDVTDEAKRTEVMQAVEQVKADLQKDATKFQELAKKYSDDKETRDKGGLMPFFSRGEKDASLERAAFRLHNDGDISDIVTTPKGFVILQRVSRKPIAFKSLDSVSKDIETIIRVKQFKDAFSKDFERIIKTLKDNPQKLVNFAQEKKATKKDLTSVERSYAPEIEKLFKLKQGSWDFYIDGNKGVVVTASNIEKSYEPELKTIKDKVEQDFIKEKALLRLQEDLLIAKKETKTKSLTQLQQQFGGSVEQTDWLKNDEPKKNADLTKKGVPVAEILKLTTPNSVIIKHDGTNGFVIKLDDIEPFNSELFANKKSEISRRLYNEKKQLNQRGFIASLLRNATIKTVENETDKTYSNDDDEML